MLEADGTCRLLMELLVGMVGELKRALGLEGPLEVMLGVPANANSNQRSLTVEAFRRHPDLPRVSVVPSATAASHEIEEHCVCSAAGTVAVMIRNVTTQYQREYTIGRWAPPAAPAVLPIKTRRRR